MSRGLSSPVPAEFQGKARRLIDGIAKEMPRHHTMVTEAWAPVVAQAWRARRSTTDRFIQELQRIAKELPLGAVNLRHITSRRGTIVLFDHASPSTMRMRSWGADSDMEKGLVISTLAFNIIPNAARSRTLRRANVSFHALGRAFQRMPQASDANVIASMRALTTAKAIDISETEDEFDINGWRGRAVGIWSQKTGWDEGDGIPAVLAVRTYGDWDISPEAKSNGVVA